MAELTQRVKEFKSRNKLFSEKSFSTLCVKNNSLGPFLVKKNIGSESVYGKTYLACHKKKCIAFKRINIINNKNEKDFVEKTYKDLETITKKHTYNGMISKIGRELALLNLSNRIVFSKVCFHFPLTFKAYICPGKDSIDNVPHILIPNELYDGDARSLFTDNYISDIDFVHFLFQIFVILLTMQKAGILHKDLHSANFLYKKVTKKGYFKYNVNGKKYYLSPNYQFTIWDFGLGMMRKDLKFNTITNLDYFIFIHIFAKQELQDFKNKGYKKIMDVIMNSFDYLQQDLSDLFKFFEKGQLLDLTIKPKGILLGESNLSKKIH